MRLSIASCCEDLKQAKGQYVQAWVGHERGEETLYQVHYKGRKEKEEERRREEKRGPATWSDNT